MKRHMRPAKARARKLPGKMNRTEQAYAEHLEIRCLAGEVTAYRYEAYKLRLADNTHYTPDFVVQMADLSIEIHEVKACKANGAFLTEDDARVKIKVAAEQFSEFQFVVAGKLPKGQGWRFERLR